MRYHALTVLLLLAGTVAVTVPGDALSRGSEPTLRLAELRTCATEGGDVILDCRVAYRTLGRLNARRDNAVVIPTWYGGSSADLLRLTGPDAFVDSTRYFVILIDALGNGVSSSPSNSVKQPGHAFPSISIGDMVEAGRRVVTEQLGLRRLHAIVGYSMGAHQVLEWSVRYPTDAGRFVSLLGSPRPTTHDAFVLRSLRWATRLGAAALPADSAYVPLVELWHTVRMTPAAESRIPLDSIDGRVFREARNGWGSFDVHDNLLQLNAMLRHDVSARFGGELERAATAVSGRLLIVTSPDDRIVSETEPVAFGRAAGAELLSVPGSCGHFVLYCDASVAERVRSFLDTANE